MIGGGAMLSKGQSTLWAAALAIAGLSAYNFIQARNLNDASRSIEALEKKAADLALADDKLLRQIAEVKVDEKYRNSRWTVLETSNRSFSSTKTYIGPFLVSVEDVKPYPGGYRIELSIGNMTSSDITTSEIIARWGGESLWIEERKGDTKEQSFDITRPLPAGAWTKVSIDLTPATEADIARISVTFEPKTVRLQQTR